jgi:hypothetical protein
LSDLLKQGRLVHTVARRLPLVNITDAHEVVERGEVVGNVVLDLLLDVLHLGTLDKDLKTSEWTRMHTNKFS